MCGIKTIQLDTEHSFLIAILKNCLRLVKFVMHTNLLKMMITFFKCLNTEKLGESAAFARVP